MNMQVIVLLNDKIEKFTDYASIKAWCENITRKYSNVEFRIIVDGKKENKYKCNCGELPEIYKNLCNEPIEIRNDHMEFLSIDNYEKRISIDFPVYQLPPF